MLRTLFLFLFLSATIALGPLLVGHQGRVIIETTQQYIVMSITSLVLILLVCLVVLLATEWLVRRIFYAGYRTKGWFFGRRNTIADKQTKLALLKMIEGDYQQAEDLFIRNADYAQQPLVNYLLAAKVAQQQNKLTNANQYIECATKHAAGNQLAVDISRTRLQLAQHFLDTAKISIESLLEKKPHRPTILNLAKNIYLQTGAYHELLNILPSLGQYGQYSDAELNDYQQRAYRGLVKQAAATKTIDELKHWWENTAKKIRNNEIVRAEMATLFIECHEHQLAKQIILYGLKQAYDERLVLLIPKLKPSSSAELEQILNKLVKKQGATALLTSVLGQLWFQQGNWQQANECLNQAVAKRPDIQDYLLLAESYDKLAKPIEAGEIREVGLRLALKNQLEG